MVRSELVVSVTLSVTFCLSITLFVSLSVSWLARFARSLHFRLANLPLPLGLRHEGENVLGRLDLGEGEALAVRAGLGLEDFELWIVVLVHFALVNVVGCAPSLGGGSGREQVRKLLVVDLKVTAKYLRFEVLFVLESPEDLASRTRNDSFRLEVSSYLAFHRVGLTSAGLPVGEHGGLEAVHNVVDNRLEGGSENFGLC